MSGVRGAVLERTGRSLDEAEDPWIYVRSAAKAAAPRIHLLRGPLSVIEVDEDTLPTIRLVDAGEITVI